jgi:two-component system sensor histidine kinase RegB
MCATLWLVFALAWFWPALHLPLRKLAPLGFAAALCRTLVLVADRRTSPPPPSLVAAALSVDALLLTGLLDITGGPFNPYLVIYAVYVWLASVTAGRLWATAVAAVAVGAFGWLVVDHLQSGLAEHHSLSDFPTHLFAMCFAGATIAELVGHYVGRARQALAQRQEELEHARERAARSDRLASLTTLAAGAAHELSTPLSTIAVAARELERTAQASAGASADSLQEDAHLIQLAVQRCRSILDGMSGRATGGITITQPMTPAAVAAMAAATLPDDRRRRFDLIATQSQCTIEAGAEVARAVSSLLKNAFDASGDQRVQLRISEDGTTVRFAVIDRGHGMSDEARRRAGEPFFTTKAAGEGLGLGLFLARTVAEQAGGSLRFEGRDGTTAILEVPTTKAGVAAP